MTDNKQYNQVNETTRNLVNSFGETSQTIKDSVITVQDRNLRFTQSLFLSWMDLLTQQTESVQHLQQQRGQQTQKQLEASQQLISASLRLFLDLFSAPLSFSRQKVDTASDNSSEARTPHFTNC